MAGLLDIIFANIDTKPLTRKEVLQHLRYLDEIITPSMPVPDQVKYWNYKVKLGRKLHELDEDLVKNTIGASMYQPRFVSQQL